MMKDEPDNFKLYGDLFWDELHQGLDFELIAKGYGEWYYDCLPRNKDAPILDVGCGSGEFLHFLQSSGYTRMEGIDLSAQQVERARKRLSCPIHHAEVGTFLKNRQGYYSMITLNDVLEHISKNDLVSFLTILRNGLLITGGGLVIFVPQAAGFSSLYNRNIDFTHQLIFTEISLRYVLKMAGFSEVRFVPERWPLKLTPRHLTYRLVRWMWFKILKLIYFIELPGQIHPSTFQIRILAVAKP
ncbi:MAG: class I SAM-dependent methyltransferase [Deltaproteobacteria bacterium]